jgi:hypothetical protein
LGSRIFLVLFIKTGIVLPPHVAAWFGGQAGRLAKSKARACKRHEEFSGVHAIRCSNRSIKRYRLLLDSGHVLLLLLLLLLRLHRLDNAFIT